MNKLIFESAPIRKHYDIALFAFQSANTISDIGKIRITKIFNFLYLALRLLVKCLIMKPDYVYFSLSTSKNSFYRDALFILIMKALKLKRIYHLHGKGIKNIAASWWGQKICAWVFKGCKVIQHSNRLYPDVKAFVPETDCFFLPNGISDINSNFESNDTFGSKNLPPVILYLSTMALTKGPIILLEALVKLKHLGINFQAKFAGEWYPDGCEIRFYDIIKRHHLEKYVRYVGPKYGEEKNKLYRNADVFVFPTYFEAFGLVILEAMQHSLPVISTYEGAIPDIIQDEVTGFLVAPKNSDAIADRLVALLDDNELRLRHGRAGRQRFLQHFTKEIFENRLLEILNSTLSH